MTITPKQLEERRKGIGSSDASAIMGCNPFSTSHDVWRSKLGIGPEFEGNAATEFGNMAEDMLRKYAAKYVGMPVVAPKGAFVKGVLRANVDGMVGKYGRGQPIVECKTTRVSEGWGEPGTDQVPPMVAVQVHHQMLAADSDFAYVIRLGMFLDVDVYEVPFNGNLGRRVLERCEAWWKRHMIDGIEPDIVPASESTMEYLNTIERDGAIEAFIDDQLIEDLEEAKRAEKRGKDMVRDAKARLHQQMGNAKVGIGNGRRAVISTVSGRVSFNQKKLRAHDEETWERYATVGSPYTMTKIKEDKE